MSGPLISVVIPSYNAGRYLHQALESVLSQDVPPKEVIVQDGGSTDDTIAILQTFEGRVLWNSEPDRGQSDALNKAIARATGDVVLWLNADDEVLPGALAAAQMKFQADPGLAFAYGDFEIIDAAGRVLRSYRTSDYTWPRVYRRGCYIFSGSLFLRRSLLVDLGGFDPRLHACMDFDLLLRLNGVERSAHLRRPIGRLRMHGSNKSMTMMRTFLRESIGIRGRYARQRPVLWPAALLATSVDAVSLLATGLRYSSRWPRHGRGKRL